MVYTKKEINKLFQELLIPEKAIKLGFTPVESNLIKLYFSSGDDIFATKAAPTSVGAMRRKIKRLLEK